ncbi:MAG: sulfotransferase [Anaerolineales bacterium]|nr:sulfotransferase [Anaerolineales bacterium]
MSAKRLLFLLGIFLVYPLWVLYLALGNLLDEIFYPGYKNESLKEPIFVIGNFRSGTTFLHRLLLEDDQSTGIRTWEIYFAPSVSYRKFINLIRMISRMIGSPVRWIVNRFDETLNDYSYMHKTGMRQYEEDSHLFYHIWSSYNLFALFPFPNLARKYIYYDQMVPEERRRIEIGYFRSLLQRHVYYHGGKRYISKNPDFSPMVETLLKQFPDAKFINIVREPTDVVPSTINMWANHWHTFGSPAEDYPLRDVLLEHIKHWYRYPHQKLQMLPENRYTVIQFAEFVTNPQKVMERVYDQFGMEISPAFRRVLKEQTIRSRSYQSRHQYSLMEMGLDEAWVQREMFPALKGYDFQDQLTEHAHEPA